LPRARSVSIAADVASTCRRRSRLLCRHQRQVNLCSLGYGDASVLFPRSPRFSFDEMARII
jgi:hypothetical protein